MISKEQYLEALTKELEIVKHLGEKIKPEQLSHKPTDAQRTMQELMQYLSVIFVAGADSIATGDADGYKKYFGGEAATVENFISLVDDEEKKVINFLTPLSEEDLAKEVTLWGRTQSRTLHLIGLLKMAAAYKMQLFLYMKQSGTADINTSNLWAGMDTPPKEPGQ